MNLMNRLAGGAAVTVLALAAASAVYAQETSGSIRGRVTDEAGAPLSGATITVRHEPTGTTAASVTNADGSFYARGLRVGGPYTVTASSGSLETGKLTIGAIGIGEAGNADIVLYSTSSVEELVVTASAVGASSQGVGSRYTAGVIETLPSATRDPKEFARLNPFVTLELSNNDALLVAGSSPRSNSLTVDGVTQNDDFGLNSSGYPTQRSPISIDAIEALEVNVAPYSVEYNKFTGANLNAVTKSGTNQFHGTLFYEFGDDSMAASRQKNRFGGFSNTAPFETKVWGATLGGPIIQDKLFFFLSYEKTEAMTPLAHGPSDSDRAIRSNGWTSAQITQIEQALATQYDFDYDLNNSLLDDGSFLEEDEKWLAKVDWNITDTQRLVFNYQLTDGTRVAIGDAPSATQIPLTSNFYNKGDRLETYGLQLLSQWTPELSTELVWNRKEVESLAEPVAGCADGPQGNGDEECEFAQVEIAQSGFASLFAGPDRSRHANELTNQLETFGAKVEYNLGDHTLLAGWLREDYEAMNLFGSQTEGRVTFANLSDFLIGRASRIRYQMAFRDNNGDGFLNEEDARIKVDYLLNSLYVQDTWQVSQELTLLAGLRYETYGGDLSPNKNETFFNRYGFYNDRTLDGFDIFLPRFSFDWRPADGLKVTGGVGLFSGGSPNVWIANSFSNDGTTLATLDCTRTGAVPANGSCPQAVKDYLNNVLAGGNDLYDLPAVVENYFNPSNPNFASAVANSPTNAIAPDFKVPSSWKASISLDKRVDFSEADWGSNWNFGFDILLTEVKDGITWLDYRAGLEPCAFAPDGRPVYRGSEICARLPTPVLRAGGTNQDLVLTNTKEGHNNAYAVRFDKVFDFGLAMRGSYTRTDATDVNPGLSSVAFSNWSNNATADVNGLRASRSNYEIKDSFKLDLGYKKQFFGDNWTRINLFAEYRSGYPYSLVFNTVSSNCTATPAGQTLQFQSGACMFGDTSSPTGVFSRQLLYVPTAGDSTVRFTTPAVQAAFDDFVSDNGLGKYRGQIVPRNSETSDWVTRVDLRLSQEIPAFFPNGAKLEAFLDVRNLANLINDDWGVQEQVEFAYMASPVTAAIEPCAGAPVACAPGQQYRYVYSGVTDVPFDTANSTAQRRSSWAMKVGLKYKF